MKAFGITSTADLSLLLAIAVPAFAQEQHEQEKRSPRVHSRGTPRENGPAALSEMN
jgi:hypothetical protein